MKTSQFVCGILLATSLSGCSKLGIPSVGGAAKPAPNPLMANNTANTPPDPAALDAAIPANATALDRAHIHEQQRRLPDALADVEKGLKANPNDKPLFIEKARIMAMEDKRDDGVALLTGYLKDHPKDKDILQAEAQILVLKGKYDEGMKVLDGAIKDYPKDATLVFDRACYKAGMKNDFTHALPDFNKAVELDPKFEEGYIKRGILYTKLKDNDKALADFSTAIKVKPDDSMAHLQRAVLLGMMKQTEKSKEDLQEVIKLNNNPQAVRLAQQILNSPSGPGGAPGGRPMMPPGARPPAGAPPAGAPPAGAPPAGNPPPAH